MSLEIQCLKCGDKLRCKCLSKSPLASEVAPGRCTYEGCGREEGHIFHTICHRGCDIELSNHPFQTTSAPTESLASPKFTNTEIPAAQIQSKYREHWPESVPTLEQIEGIQHVVEVLTPVPEQSKTCKFSIGQSVKWMGQDGPKVGTVRKITHPENSGFVLWLGDDETEEFPILEAEIPPQPLELRRFVFDDFCEQCSHEAACAIKGGCLRESPQANHQDVFCQKHNAELNTLPATAYCLICENEKKSAAPRPQEPRCPKCSRTDLLLWPEGHPQQVSCCDCHRTFQCETVSDFSQFFTPAQNQGAASIKLGQAVYVSNPQFTGYGIAKHDSGSRKRVISVLLENGNEWEYDAETVRNATANEYHKMPRAIQNLVSQGAAKEEKP